MSFGVMVASPENLVWMCRSIRVVFFLILFSLLVFGFGMIRV